MVDYGKFSVNTWNTRINEQWETRRARHQSVMQAHQRRIENREWQADFNDRLKQVYEQSSTAGRTLEEILKDILEGKGNGFDDSG